MDSTGMGYLGWGIRGYQDIPITGWFMGLDFRKTKKYLGENSYGCLKAGVCGDADSKTSGKG
jgi:hypothetical protein